MKSRIWEIDTEELQRIANMSNSISDMLEYLGYQRNYGSVANTLKKVIQEKEIDTSHFNPFARNHQKVIHPIDEILTKDSRYTNMERLKIRLVSEGYLEYKCALCGNVGEWNGKPLSLQIDHINGVHSDNRIDNLRFLCPNYHSQTDTYSGRNNKTHQK